MEFYLQRSGGRITLGDTYFTFLLNYFYPIFEGPNRYESISFIHIPGANIDN